MDQGEAAVTLSRIRLDEVTRHRTESAFGPRDLTLETALVIDRSTPTVDRTIRLARIGDRDIVPDDGDRRRRFQSPIRRDLLRAADGLLYPERLLGAQESLGDAEPDRLDSREVIRVQTVSTDEAAPVERVTWYFSRPSGRLLRARGVIRGEDRGTLVVTVDYDRIEGLDLPVSRFLEGSFAIRRRTRTYTVLVESNSQYRVVSLEAL